MKKINLLLLTAAMWLLSSCVARVVDFTIISTKNFDYTKGATYKQGTQRIKGRDLAHWIIIVPTRQIDIKEAVDNAIESVPGCVALLDGVVYQKFWWIPYIYGQQSYVVEGTPLIDPAQGGTGALFHKIELDKHGKIRKTESINSSEYYTLKERITRDIQPRPLGQENAAVD